MGAVREIFSHIIWKIKALVVGLFLGSPWIYKVFGTGNSIMIRSLWCQLSFYRNATSLIHRNCLFPFIFLCGEVKVPLVLTTKTPVQEEATTYLKNKGNLDFHWLSTHLSRASEANLYSFRGLPSKGLATGFSEFSFSEKVRAELDV